MEGEGGGVRERRWRREENSVARVQGGAACDHSFSSLAGSVSSSMIIFDTFFFSSLHTFPRVADPVTCCVSSPENGGSRSLVGAPGPRSLVGAPGPRSLVGVLGSC